MPDLAELNIRIKSLEAKVASDRLDDLGRSAGRADSQMTGLIGTATILAGVMATLRAALLTVERAAAFEQTEIAFATLLGSGEAARDMLEDLVEFAAKTPFELEGITNATRLLLAMGFQAEDTIRLLTITGDQAAALGEGAQERMQFIIRALGQIQAKGKVSAQEMNQLAEQGIGAWQMLADAIGVDVAQAMKMAESGALRAAPAIEAILRGMAANTQGAMENLSQSTGGLFSTLKDEVDDAMRSIGKTLIEELDIKGFLRDQIASMDEYKQILLEFIEGLTGMSTGVDDVRKSIELLTSAIKALAAALAISATSKAMQWMLAMRMGPYAATAAAGWFSAEAIFGDWKPQQNEPGPVTETERQLLLSLNAENEMRDTQMLLDEIVGKAGFSAAAEDLESMLQELTVMVYQRDKTDRNRMLEILHERERIQHILDTGTTPEELERQRIKNSLRPLQPMQSEEDAIDFSTPADPEKLRKQRMKEIESFTKDLEKLSERGRQALFDVMHMDDSEIDRELASIDAFYKEFEDRYIGHEETLAFIQEQKDLEKARAREEYSREQADIRFRAQQEEEDRLKELLEEENEARQQAQESLRAYTSDLQFELELLKLGSAERERAIELREAEARAAEAFPDSGEKQLEVLQDVEEKIRDIQRAQTWDTFTTTLATGVENAFIDGVWNWLNNDDWKEMLHRSLLQVSQSAFTQGMQALFTNQGTESSPFLSLGKTIVGALTSTGGGDAPADGGTNVVVYNVPDEATADMLAAKTSSDGAKAVVAKGSGQPGITSGRIAPGRKR